MKKVLLNILLCFGALFSCFAQSEHRISLGVGLFSYEYINEWLDERADVDYYYPGSNDHGTYEYPDNDLKSLPNNLNLHYECTLGKHFGVGLCLNYDRFRMHNETEVITSVGEQTSPQGVVHTLWNSYNESGNIHRHIFSIMPEATVYWFKKNHVAMYSKLGAGVRWKINKKTVYTPQLKKTEDKDTHFCCQISPVCVEVGGHYWRAYVEIGYGIQGIGQVGVKHTFRGTGKNTEE